jgi:hypothetical protein
MPGKSRHLLLFRGRGRRRRGGRRCIGVLLLAALAKPRRHRGALDLGAAANGAADQGFLFLALVALAVLEPAFEFMAFGAAQSV